MPPRPAILTRLALAVVLAIVLARCLMLETVRGVDAFVADAGANGPGAATAIVLDWLSFVPLLLVLARRAVDATYRPPFNAAHVLLAALAAWTLASVGWADDRFLSLLNATRVAGGAAIFVAVSQLVTRPAHVRVVVGIVVGLLLVNVVQGALYQNVDLPDTQRYFEAHKAEIFAARGWQPGDYVANRFEKKVLAGEMLNYNASANVLGAVVVTCALAAIGAAAQRVRDRDEHGWAGALLLIAAGCAYVLAHTGSKASCVALAFGIALLAAWRLTCGWLARHRLLAFSGGVAAVAIGIGGLIAYGLSRGGLPSDSLNFRWRYWQGAWALVREHPLRGIGWGNFGDFYLAHRVPAAAEEVQDPHSFPVRWAVELGVVGLALGVAWLVAWAYTLTLASTRSHAPSPGPSGAGRDEGPDLQTTIDAPTVGRRQHVVKTTLAPTLSQGNGRGNGRPSFGGHGSTTEDALIGESQPMPIGYVLLALLPAFLLSVVCATDFTGDASYALFESMRRAMFFGVIALCVGLVCIGRRASADAPFVVDERPAPWLVAGLFVGVLMLMLQSTIDVTLFQPGPWVLAMLMMGTLIGITLSRDATPSPVFAGEQPRSADHGRRCVPAYAIVGTLTWLAAAVVVVRVATAEHYAGQGDAMMSRTRTFFGAGSHAYSDFNAALGVAPVSNFEYAEKAAGAAMLSTEIESPRPMLDAAIDAAPHHAMSWLTRSRYLVAQKDVAPADQQQPIDDFARAVALNPNDVDLRIEYADLLERFGRRAEAAMQLEAALALDDQLDPKEPERLALRSPGTIERLRTRLRALRAA